METSQIINTVSELTGFYIAQIFPEMKLEQAINNSVNKKDFTSKHMSSYRLNRIEK